MASFRDILGVDDNDHFPETVTSLRKLLEYLEAQGYGDYPVGVDHWTFGGSSSIYPTSPDASIEETCVDEKFKDVTLPGFP